MNKKILVIDDEPDLAEVLAERLKVYKFDVDTASNGIDGLQKISQNLPDLIILDIMMPGMSGAELASKLKNNEMAAGIPIIFLSALQTKREEQRQGNVIGGNVVFAKPYDLNLLVAKINEMVSFH